MIWTHARDHATYGQHHPIPLGRARPPSAAGRTWNRICAIYPPSCRVSVVGLGGDQSASLDIAHMSLAHGLSLPLLAISLLCRGLLRGLWLPRRFCVNGTTKPSFTKET